MRSIIVLLATLTFSLSYGNEKKETLEFVKYEIPLEKTQITNSDMVSNDDNKIEIELDCHEIAYAYLEAGLSSGMLINEAYDAAFAAYQTCEAINMM